MKLSGPGRGNKESLRRNGNPNWYPGMPSATPRGNPDLNESKKRRKIASDWLISFYNAHPARLKRLLMRLVEEAEKGKNIRYAEIVINLLEGPAKEQGTGDTYNFNFLSDAERLKAQDSVKRIKAMKRAITVLPEATSGTEPERCDEDSPRSDSLDKGEPSLGTSGAEQHLLGGQQGA